MLTVEPISIDGCICNGGTVGYTFTDMFHMSISRQHRLGLPTSAGTAIVTGRRVTEWGDSH